MLRMDNVIKLELKAFHTVTSGSYLWVLADP